jgi:hypothetical protein
MRKSIRKFDRSNAKFDQSNLFPRFFGAYFRVLVCETGVQKRPPLVPLHEGEKAPFFSS